MKGILKLIGTFLKGLLVIVSLAALGDAITWLILTYIF